MTETRINDMQRTLDRHLGECTEQNKAVGATLFRIEARMDGFDKLILKAAFGVIGAQAVFLGIIFTAYFAWKHA